MVKFLVRLLLASVFFTFSLVACAKPKDPWLGTWIADDFAWCSETNCLTVNAVLRTDEDGICYHYLKIENGETAIRESFMCGYSVSSKTINIVGGYHTMSDIQGIWAGTYESSWIAHGVTWDTLTHEGIVVTRKQ